MCRDLTHEVEAVKPDRAETDGFRTEELPLRFALLHAQCPPGLSTVGWG